MLTNLQKRTAQAIVNVFETGEPTGNYGEVTFRKDDVGCLTFGRSQTTLASGGLALLIAQYCSSPLATGATELRSYLTRLEARDRSLDSDAKFTALLKRAGADPAMRPIEDDFFDRAYWNPAVRAAESLAVESALGTAVVYDSFIHGAWARLRDSTLARLGLPARASLPAIAAAPASDTGSTHVGERTWIGKYLTLRREWLANHSNPLLRRAVYRMDTFLALTGASNWDLALPLQAHGATISEATFTLHPHNPPLVQASRYNQSASKLESDS
ncbi:MAG TPA: chitosanase [Candidatus Acidoferrales bacterium]|nr:chitosanase [Candidatus Acidoferrales bacterium]